MIRFDPVTGDRTILNNNTIPVEDNHGGLKIPQDYTLYQNYPNPFNPATRITYTVSVTSNISKVVYDALGREINTLVNEVETPGNYTVQFDGTDLSSGVYFYTIRTQHFVQTKKMLLLK